MIADQMAVECINEVFGGGIGSAPAFRAAGIIDQYVDRIILSHKISDGFFNLRRVLKISYQVAVFLARCGVQFWERFCQFLFVSRHENHFCPQQRDFQARCKAQSLGASAYQRSFTRQIQVHANYFIR